MNKMQQNIAKQTHKATEYINISQMCRPEL